MYGAIALAFGPGVYMKKVLGYFKSKKGKKTEKAASFAKSHSTVGQPVIPDPELQYSFEAIKLLGQGSTGQTWLCKECKTSELVAVKLIPRPFPKALLPSHVEREIKVCLCSSFTIAFALGSTL